MLPPTAKNVRTMVNIVKAHSDMSAVDVADLLGVSYSSLKKNQSDGASHRPMQSSTWQLLLLMADRHPHYELVDRHK